jgi:hypothetical protein
VVVLNTWQWRQLDSGGVRSSGGSSSSSSSGGGASGIDSMEEELGRAGSVMSEKLMFLQARLTAAAGSGAVSSSGSGDSGGVSSRSSLDAAGQQRQQAEGGAVPLASRDGDGDESGRAGLQRRLFGGDSGGQLLRRPAPPVKPLLPPRW